MPINIGSTTVSKLYVGSTPVKSVYLGSTQVWTANPPSYVDVSQAAQNSASASVTVNYPAGSASGDLIVVFAGFQRVPTSGTQTLSAPAGWTEVAEQANSVGQVAAVYWKVRGAETSVTITCNNASSEYGTAICHAYRGFNATSPINAVTITLDNSVNVTTARTMPQVTTTVDNCAVSYFYNSDRTTGSTTATWSNATERSDAYSGTNGRMMYGSATGATQVTAGSTPSNVSWAPAAIASESLLATVAIAP